MWTRAMIKTRAKTVLKVSYWKAFLVSLVIALAEGGLSGSSNWKNTNQFPKNIPDSLSSYGTNLWSYVLLLLLGALLVIILALAFRVLLGYPLEVGGKRYFLRSTQNDFDLNNLGFAFDKGKYWSIVKAMFWRGFINFLWVLLLIIPGIIKYYAYKMVPYILADNPRMDYRRALELSTKMTKGQKAAMFVLDLSFIGWYLLGTLALLVGVLFVLPYQNATNAELYIILRQNALNNGFCTYEELTLNRDI